MTPDSGNALRQGGFTLLEMMVALGLLIVGMTSVLGALSSGLGTRRQAEMRSRASLLAEQVLGELRVDPSRAGEAFSAVGEAIDEGAEAPPPVVVERIEGYPGMRYTLFVSTDPDYPEMVLVRLRVAWRSQGEFTGTEFHRLLPRTPTLSRRVAEREGENR